MREITRRSAIYRVSDDERTPLSTLWSARRNHPPLLTLGVILVRFFARLLLVLRCALPPRSLLKDGKWGDELPHPHPSVLRDLARRCVVSGLQRKISRQVRSTVYRRSSRLLTADVPFFLCCSDYGYGCGVLVIIVPVSCRRQVLRLGLLTSLL